MPKRPSKAPSGAVKSLIRKATGTPSKSKPVRIYTKGKTKNA